MTRTPFPHQKEGAEYLIRKGGGFLYMEQRTGKTLTTVLALLQKNFERVLIVTKSTIMPVWYEELVLEGVSPGDIIVVSGTKPARERLLTQEAEFMICNYEMLKIYRVLDRHQWDAIIFDESSAISNLSAKVTRYVMMALSRRRKAGEVFVACLSGSPAPETPMQYATQFIAVQGTYFGEREAVNYIWKYWKDDLSHPGKQVVRNREHLDEIRHVVQQEAFVRTMEQLNLGSQVLYSRRFVSLNAEQQEQIRWCQFQRLRFNLATDGLGDLIYIGYINQVASGLNPQTGKMISLEKVKEVLGYYQENPEPILVLSFFKEPLRAGLKLFQEKGIRSRLITGETSLKERELIRKQFQDGSLDVVFGQTDAVKMGLDFSKAGLTFYISNSFSNDSRDQSVMRTTNVNKKTPVQIIDICTRNTLDDAIVDRLVTKEALSESYLIKKTDHIRRIYD